MVYSDRSYYEQANRAFDSIEEGHSQHSHDKFEQAQSPFSQNVQQVPQTHQQ